MSAFAECRRVLERMHIWEILGFWDMGQNAVAQWDCRNFKSTIPVEQNDEKAWFSHVHTNLWKLKI